MPLRLFSHVSTVTFSPPLAPAEILHSYLWGPEDKEVFMFQFHAGNILVYIVFTLEK